jgi:DNA-binding phage protein
LHKVSGMTTNVRRTLSGIQLQLYDAIEADGRSYYMIAKDAGLRPETLYRFRDGERDLTLHTAARIAAALGLELRAIR